MNEAQLLAVSIYPVDGGWSYLEASGTLCADVYPTREEAIFAFGIYSHAQTVHAKALEDHQWRRHVDRTYQVALALVVGVFFIMSLVGG